MNSNWIYYGVFFDDDTKQKIYKHAKNLCYKHGIQFPEDWQFYCDHMTLVFNNGNPEEQTLADFYETMLGEEETLRCIGFGVSNKVFALWIDFTTNNKHSHVTVVVGPNGKPVDSNYITNWIKDSGKNLEIKGTYKKISK